MLVNNYWSPILADKLKSTVANSTDNLYQANFDDAQLHVLEGRIVIHNITLKPDTSIYNALKKAHLAPNNLYELHVKKLVLKHIHPFKLYFNHKLDIGEIVLSAPMLKVSYQLNHAKDTVVKDKRTLYQQISKSLKMIHIGKVILNDVKLRYENHKGAKVAVSELQDLNLSAIDLLIDSATQFDKSRFLYCREMNAELNNYSGQSANGLYKYKAKQVTFSTRTSQLNAYDCSLIATRPPEEFFEHTYKDRFVSHLDSLQLNNFDFEVYNKYHTISGSNLILTNGSINIFGNPRKNPKADTVNKIRNFPNVAIFRLPNLKIDTISLRSIDASYEEYNSKTKQAGIVRFDRTRGYFYNVTNDSAALTKNHFCKINLNTQFMNRGNLNVDFIFNLTDKRHAYSYKGRLGAMSLPAVNPASKALASVAITSGRLNSLEFDMQGNSEVATGNVTLLYNNLKVQLLKADTTKLKMKHMTIASFFANALIIKHNNPDNSDTPPRSIPVTFQRPIDYPFFKTVWHTLLAGIKPSFGLDAASQQSVKDRLEEHKQNVIERKQKKQIRIEKREQRRRMKAYKASLKNKDLEGK
ncbi:hypothetical protein [Mucilaginibacter jinjuensis]|uniref:AsmA-like protein n=1 Tax=Mucilaginibacter jinjuensis TaxID=1176721 RepID=A0ABY7TAU1_9SPHI|nr:hypothetical protein [Mucilaginibacter jinjuensis]WCT12848.1 hypothetical protein PQO05_02730 [Mucilaginibacter jinjuensis]